MNYLILSQKILRKLKTLISEEEKRVDLDELSSFEATALSTLDDISQKVNVKDPKERRRLRRR